MSNRNWQDRDLDAFWASFASSLSPSSPLPENLRAVIFPALAKLRRYSGASVALHFFVNPFQRQVHAAVCGASKETGDVVVRERTRRAEAEDLRPSPGLPHYSEQPLKSIQATQDLFKELDEEYRIKLAGDLLHIMQTLARERPGEFGGQQPRNGDLMIVLPLRSKRYPKLGYFVLWSPDSSLKETEKKVFDRIIRRTFSIRIHQLMVWVFRNYYGMAPDTYLPSYYWPGRKKVTLLSAQIRDFDRIWANIELHGGLESKHKEKCRLNLLSGFGRIATQAIESSAHQGRVDQNWGSGILAVFGEYLGTEEKRRARVGVKQALSAASDMICSFDKFAEQWMADEFRSGEFHEYSTFLSIIPSIVVAVDWAPVLFDYFGSVDHRVYMAVGERVNFVKELGAVAGRVISPISPHNSSPPSNISFLDDYRGAPILLSHSATLYSKDLIGNSPSQPITLPGRSDRTHVCPVFVKDVSLNSTTQLPSTE